MEQSQPLTGTRKVIFVTLALVIILGGLYYLFYYLIVKPPYKLRPDIFNYKTYLLAAIIFVPLIVIDLKREEKEEKHITWITFFIIIIIGTPLILGMLMLKINNPNFATTQAFVKRTYYARGSFYTLQFADNELISNKEFDISEQIISHKNDCLKVKYRENALVIEVRPIENLGAMTKEECLNK